MRTSKGTGATDLQAGRVTKTLNCADEVRADEERFRRLFETVTDCSIVGLDVDGLITSWSRGAERMKGFTAGEIVGRHFSCFYPTQAITNGHPEKALRTAAEKGHFEEQGWRVRRRGARFWAEVVITAILDKFGAVQGFSEVTRDITDRRLALQRLDAERQRAENANRAKSDFLAAMSHEIRTPMNAILGMADVLFETELDGDQMQYVEVLRRAGSSLLVLINDILDISKIEAGHVDLQNVEFNLEEVVDQAIELTAVKARSKGIRLLSCLVPGLATSLIGDPARLRQILINLLGNAVKFTDAGEVVLTVENHESGRPGEISFAVSDTGIGIPAAKLKTIFDDFIQAGDSTAQKYGGTGLGLGISRRLVESMKGKLTVVSEVGVGSTFRFTALFGVQSGPQEAVELQDVRGRRVLVIDDNATNCLILRETLRGWGMIVDVFRSPEKALADLAQTMAGEQPYSLVLVDNFMPEKDGFETTAEIRRIAPSLPVAMLTSDVRSCNAARRREVGLAGYAIRPVKRGDLLRLTRTAMKGPADVETSTLGRATQTQATGGRSLRILIAEDSQDNRLLLQAFLKSYPHTLVFADDGKAAVAQFVASDFDLVLMDVQMPVMDGLTATRAIRALEREWGSRAVPILALTANARPEDIASSHNAGCTGHLCKPISKDTFLGAIEKYSGNSTPPRKTPNQQIDVAIPTGLEGLVPDYLVARQAEIPRMAGYLANSDFERLSTLAHDLKGTGESFGFSDLTRLGAAIELSAVESDPEAVGKQLTELENYLKRVRLVAKG